MTAIAMAARLIRQCEGCVLTPYADTGGTWTIGIGSIHDLVGDPVTADTPPITMQDADDLMMAELRPTAERVDAMVTVPITDGMRAALYSFAYNEGTGALHGSTILRLLNAGDIAGALSHFAEWDMAGGRVVLGLDNRRRLEVAVAKGNVVP
jgi:lysozyme